MNTNLSATQQQILEHACAHGKGQLTWFPDTLKGGARQKVLDSLVKHALIKARGNHWLVTASGYQALGLHTPTSEATQPSPVAQPRTHANSKQAQVITMLRRDEGASVEEIILVTGWQAHTVRGMLSGALRKKLGLNLTSNKDQGHRVYRITEEQ